MNTHKVGVANDALPVVNRQKSSYQYQWQWHSYITWSADLHGKLLGFSVENCFPLTKECGYAISACYSPDPEHQDMEEVAGRQIQLSEGMDHLRMQSSPLNLS